MASKPGGKGGVAPANVSQPKSGQSPTSSEGNVGGTGHVFGTHTGGVGGTRKS